jgi:hypothetical protein
MAWDNLSLHKTQLRSFRYHALYSPIRPEVLN